MLNKNKTEERTMEDKEVTGDEVKEETQVETNREEDGKALVFEYQHRQGGNGNEGKRERACWREGKMKEEKQRSPGDHHRKNIGYGADTQGCHRGERRRRDDERQACERRGGRFWNKGCLVVERRRTGWGGEKESREGRQNQSSPGNKHNTDARKAGEKADAWARHREEATRGNSEQQPCERRVFWNKGCLIVERRRNAWAENESGEGRQNQQEKRGGRTDARQRCPQDEKKQNRKRGTQWRAERGGGEGGKTGAHLAKRETKEKQVGVKERENDQRNENEVKKEGREKKVKED